MEIKNNTNGKIIEIKKSAFDKLSPRQKSNFSILSDKDVVEATQVTENLLEKKKKSEKKTEDSPAVGEQE